jgi:hypothetical protein
VILDAFGNGMCCAYGEGSIALYAVVDDSDMLITSSNGTFGFSQTIVFTVPDLAIRSGLSNKKIKKSRTDGDQ